MAQGSELKDVFALNVAKVVAHHHDKVPLRNRVSAAAKKLDMLPYALKRLMIANHHPRTDTVERIARAYHYPPHELLMPEFNPTKKPRQPITPAMLQRTEALVESASMLLTLVRENVSEMDDASTGKTTGADRHRTRKARRGTQSA